jgi:hypothetical protein
MESFSVYKVIPDASELLAPSIEVVKVGGTYSYKQASMHAL